MGKNTHIVSHYQ